MSVQPASKGAQAKQVAHNCLAELARKCAHTTDARFARMRPFIPDRYPHANRVRDPQASPPRAPPADTTGFFKHLLLPDPSSRSGSASLPIPAFGDLAGRRTPPGCALKITNSARGCNVAEPLSAISAIAAPPMTPLPTAASDGRIYWRAAYLTKTSRYAMRGIDASFRPIAGGMRD